MKCSGCGAQLDSHQLICPYCGRLNHLAKERKETIDHLEQENQRTRRHILEENKVDIIYHIYRKVNIALLIVMVVAVVFSFEYDTRVASRMGSGRGSKTAMKQYYEAGDLENLYYCMSDGDYFDPDAYYDYSQAALMWSTYMDCQNFFADAYEDYLEKGAYDGYAVERCVEEGLSVLTGNISYTYPASNMSERNQELIKPYQEKVCTLFTGMMQIPEEALANMDKEKIYNYEKEEELTSYVKEALPCEDN